MAASHARAAAPASHWIEIGLLAGILVSLVLPIWLRWIVAIADAVALGWLTTVMAHANRGNATWIFIAVVCLGAGLYFGRARGLRHLGQYEFGVRHGYIKDISPF